MVASRHSLRPSVTEIPRPCSSFTSTLNDSGIPGSGRLSPLTIASKTLDRPNGDRHQRSERGVSTFFLAQQRHSYGTIDRPNGAMNAHMDTSADRIYCRIAGTYIRRGWDSNPRRSYPDLGFQVRCRVF